MSHFIQSVLVLAMCTFVAVAICFNVSYEDAAALAAICFMVSACCVVFLP
jgi:hypothetical protein